MYSSYFKNSRNAYFKIGDLYKNSLDFILSFFPLFYFTTFWTCQATVQKEDKIKIIGNTKKVNQRKGRTKLNKRSKSLENTSFILANEKDKKILTEKTWNKMCYKEEWHKEMTVEKKLWKEKYICINETCDILNQ